MTILTDIGFLFAIPATVLGLVGAYYTSAADVRDRHFGFKCWVVNSPCLIISLACYEAWSLIPLNACYLYTAYRGWQNTKIDPVNGVSD